MTSARCSAQPSQLRFPIRSTRTASLDNIIQPHVSIPIRKEVLNFMAPSAEPAGPDPKSESGHQQRQQLGSVCDAG